MKVGISWTIVLVLIAVSACSKPTVENDGGVRLVYRIGHEKDNSAGRSMKASQKRVIEAIDKLLLYVEDVRVWEVSARGDDKVIIEVIGEVDKEALKRALGVAKLEFMHAKNVSTILRPRKYKIGSDIVENGQPVVRFEHYIGSSGEFGPGDDEYAEMIAQWDTILSGSDLEDAMPYRLGNGEVIPEFTFTADGAKKMERWSRSVMGRGEFLAFVINGVVVSIAPLRDGAIISDSAVIEGEFELDYVVTLTSQLRIAAINVNLTLVSEEEFPN